MKRALVIDDNEIFRETVADLLEEIGYEASVVESAEEAEQHFEGDQEFELILCDLVLPTEFSVEIGEDDGSAMVGLNTVREITSRFPKTPVIAMSGMMEGATLRAMESIAKCETLKKPFSIDQLSSAIKRAAMH